MNNPAVPWEQPRVKRILELFNGHIVEVKQLVVRRTADGEIRR